MGIIIDNKYELLQKEMYELVQKGMCLAFSGGVDSSLLLKIACDMGRKQQKEVHAVLFETKLHPMGDMEAAKEIAQELGAVFHVISVNELDNPSILMNPIDRCYQCKAYLFQQLYKYADTLGLSVLVDGTNADDLLEYRPGIKALQELSVHSPLAALGITKQMVREYASELGLSVANRPSAPCLATRLPYNTKIDFDTLERLDAGELYLKNLGYDIVRLRLYQDLLRIEIEPGLFLKFLNQKQEIINYLKELGFVYITLDMEGFRSGSMDIKIKMSEKQNEK